MWMNAKKTGRKSAKCGDLWWKFIGCGTHIIIKTKIARKKVYLEHGSNNLEWVKIKIEYKSKRDRCMQGKFLNKILAEM